MTDLDGRSKVDRGNDSPREAALKRFQGGGVVVCWPSKFWRFTKELDELSLAVPQHKDTGAEQMTELQRCSPTGCETMHEVVRSDFLTRVDQYTLLTRQSLMSMCWIASR